MKAEAMKPECQPLKMADMFDSWSSRVEVEVATATATATATSWSLVSWGILNISKQS